MKEQPELIHCNLSNAPFSRSPFVVCTMKKHWHCIWRAANPNGSINLLSMVMDLYLQSTKEYVSRIRMKWFYYLLKRVFR